MPEYIVTVPADTQTVRRFVNAERELILKDLAVVRDTVTKALVAKPVYKIYGRDEKQDGDPIKHRRKIRLKFNDYHLKQSLREGSLWTVPDIIGFTVVVPYPSDITDICEAIDGLVDGGGLLSETATSSGPTAASEIIKSRYGRPIVSGGYFACHYNLRVKGVSTFRPFCEIQIKTILHDGWGAKTHDLTYKPRGRISEDMVGSFNLLGDTLAKIDQQSDLVRQGIERSSAPRDKKKRAVQLATIQDQADAACKDPRLAAVFDLAKKTSVMSSVDEVQACQDALYAEFPAHPKEVCYLYALLAVRTNRESVRQQTLEALEAWHEKLTDVFELLFSRNVAGLIGYCSDDLSSAIEFGEEAQRIGEGVDRSTLDHAGNLRLTRLLNALYSSLAYYHADLIGSHDGRLTNSFERALHYIELCKPFRSDLGIPELGLSADEAALRNSLSEADERIYYRIFQTLENEAYVRIQTAQSEEDLRDVRKKLDLIYSTRPHGLVPAADKFLDYHDYCARARLAELESVEAYLPSSS